MFAGDQMEHGTSSREARSLVLAEIDAYESTRDCRRRLHHLNEAHLRLGQLGTEVFWSRDPAGREAFRYFRERLKGLRDGYETRCVVGGED